LTTVIWIDWYSYHVSRFRALSEHHALKGQVTGIELIGGCGVHSGLKFRDADREGLAISSLLPAADWENAGQIHLARAVWKKLQQLKPSAVLVPGYYTLPALTAALWARVHRKRSVLMSETTQGDYPRVWCKELPKRILVQSLFDYGIAGGKPHVRYLSQLGFSSDKIARFYDVVDNRFYQEAADQARRTPALRQQLELPENYLLYVGRLAPEKNIDGLIAAFACYCEAGGPWSLVLVGDGAERTRLEKQCVALGIAGRVRFIGLKNARETVPYYAFAGCFVLPSTREPWGLVVNEAMAAGLPVIVSQRCGCAEDLVTPDGNGFVFDPTTPNQLTECLLRMSAFDRTTIGAMGRKSQEIIAGYTPQHWAAEVARLVN
jgi:1,2-diacylglycerol 3-alpha-glucosyltransferase